MPFLHFLFSPQAHKTNSGYYINHDSLMSVSPQDRHKLIFYFIAQQTPQKLSLEDRKSYYDDKKYRIQMPISLITIAGMALPIILSPYRNPQILKLRPFKSIAILLGLGCIGANLGNTIGYRAVQAKMVESSSVIENLSKKYNFGIYDFSVAKKESHIKHLMKALDVHHDTLHQFEQ